MSGKTELKPDLKNFRSAIVLAGGRGNRMGMVEKALLEFEGKTILERLLASLFQVVDEVVLSVRNRTQEAGLRPVLENFQDRKIRFCFDSVEGAGPLEGIRTGLLKASSKYAFVCAGDMPFINSGVVELLFEKAEGHDAALPKYEEKTFEPLHAVYSKKLVPEIERAFERGEHSVLAPVFRLQDTVFVGVSEIRGLDPKLRTFVNVNTVEDLKRIPEATGDSGLQVLNAGFKFS